MSMDYRKGLHGLMWRLWRCPAVWFAVWFALRTANCAVKVLYSGLYHAVVARRGSTEFAGLLCTHKTTPGSLVRVYTEGTLQSGIPVGIEVFLQLTTPLNEFVK